jgi:hypothetical protein
VDEGRFGTYGEHAALVTQLLAVVTDVAVAGKTEAGSEWGEQAQ